VYVSTGSILVRMLFDRSLHKVVMIRLSSNQER